MFNGRKNFFILIKFIKYVNENSRTLRYMFVNFAGKKEIKVIMIDSLKDYTLQSGRKNQLMQYYSDNCLL